jgi:uncharacterized protein (DUF2252 family)
MDIAHKVVGVGSVGTRALIVVMQGADSNDHLVLQIKEAQESVLERFCGKSEFPQHGQRVVEGQHAIQTASDMLLGWCRLPDENKKSEKNQYVDMYYSVIGVSGNYNTYKYERCTFCIRHFSRFKIYKRSNLKWVK